ncbi:MAG: insulinase family protein [Melioribacter sp.]|nr:insulinase family protein [Melioribacter sp.]
MIFKQITTRTILFSFLFLILSLSLTAETNKYEEGKVYRHKLANGLTVLTMERHIAPLIYHQLTYKVGSRNEKLGATGISHVVEHMMFKGTSKYRKGEVSKTITDNSGIFNAFTSNDMTSYFEYLPKNKIELAMDIESDRMFNSTFNPDEFKSEIEVIKQERRLRTESNANGLFREELMNIAYKSHPNQNPVIGWPGDLSHITRDDAYTYYKTYYTPNNAFLVLVGDFDTDNIVELAKKYYSGIPKGPDVQDIYELEEQQVVQKIFKLYHVDFATPGISMNFHIPSYDNPDAPKLRVASKILCARSRTARLYKILVTEKRLATVAAGGFGVSKDPTLFSISVKLKEESKIDTVQKIVFDEIKKMQDQPVSDYELQKVKNNFQYDELTTTQKNADLGSRISTYEAFHGWDSYENFKNALMEVTKEDIMEVMKKYFSPEKMTMGLTLPDKNASKLKNRKKAAEENEEEDKNLGVFFYTPSASDCTLENNYNIGDDEIIKPKQIRPLIKETKLSNGVKLYTIEDHLTPTIVVAGIMDTGLLPEEKQDQKWGAGNMLAGLMNKGTVKESYDEISERMSFVPFSFVVGGGTRSFSFSGQSLLKNADELFETGMDILTHPRLDDKEIEKVREDMILSAKNRMTNKSMEAFYYMYNKVYEGHPLSTNSSSEESLKKITKEDLIQLHNKYVRPEHLSLLLVGDIKHSEMEKLAEKYFGNWKVSSNLPSIVKMPVTSPLKEKQIKVFQEKNYTQCTINIGFSPSNEIKEEEAEAVNILNNILAASALTSRMGVELRDKRGLYYGLKSELHSQSKGIGYWKMNTKTAPKNTANLIKGIFEQIKLLIDKGITDKELETAKNHFLGLLPFYIETTDDIAQMVFDSFSKETSLDMFDKKAERIKSVTKEDVIKMAKKYFTLDKFVVVVDGPIEEHSLDNLINEL